jgi:hypothetical protein
MADYRTWQTAIENYHEGLLEPEFFYSSLGKTVASEYLAFAALAHQLPTPDQVRIDPNGAPVPTTRAAQYLISSMLAQGYAHKNDCEPFVTYMLRLPRIYQMLLARDLFRKAGEVLSGYEIWNKWFVDNQNLF